MSQSSRRVTTIHRPSQVRLITRTSQIGLNHPNNQSTEPNNTSSIQTNPPSSPSQTLPYSPCSPHQSSLHRHPSASGSLITRAIFGRNQPRHLTRTRANTQLTRTSVPASLGSSNPTSPSKDRRAQVEQSSRPFSDGKMFQNTINKSTPGPTQPGFLGDVSKVIQPNATQEHPTNAEDELGPLPPFNSPHLVQMAHPITNANQEDEEESEDGGMISEDEEIDLLEVVDPAVHTASTLTHIQNSIFIPLAFNRYGSPVIDDLGTAVTPSRRTSLRTRPKSPVHDSSPIPSARRSRIRRGSILIGNQDSPTIDEESGGPANEAENSIDNHIIEIVDHGRRQTIRRILRGARAFICTPLGVLFAIYGFLVVFWVLILLKWIKIEPLHRYRIWVEICSQILNGLFTITGIGLLPSRLIDWWNISIVIHYARIIWRRKGKKNLGDPNDILPLDIERAKAEKEVACTKEPTQKLRRKRRVKPCAKLEDERRILSEPEIIRLERAQSKLCRSQTWYRPHSSPTHYAFPIWGAFAILICNIGNSIFQAALCGVMWGLTYSHRPAWTTATFMAASFSCGIASAILIWQVGQRTRKSEEVMAKVEAILKGDDGQQQDEHWSTDAEIRSDGEA
ncbi:hypothetical protein CROQUDRAFT_672018 [Cronartium quercuum f. sp. fusiforme G11]|uniref:Uncharacterized protein n=1 Tax=Cronartium quercuum f. sp. fusiforme G11 TaxID=708437 RepID=A0A9P6NK02_9BASI|nr:hypothetical protein CROQUDRAFT_672018 [Cronartium quercuum f. sp. fusiforme G11]